MSERDYEADSGTCGFRAVRWAKMSTKRMELLFIQILLFHLNLGTLWDDLVGIHLDL